MRSRTRFAVALALLQCVGVCAGAACVGAGAGQGRRRGRAQGRQSELVHLDAGRARPAACRQVPGADRDQGPAPAHRRPGGAAAPAAGGQRRPARRRRDDHVGCRRRQRPGQAGAVRAVQAGGLRQGGG